uniref:Lipase maturation factor 2 n=1 Tax=Picocystis salinarum TaxID=88271 RepID=A0A7S3UC39_9CHLO
MVRSLETDTRFVYRDTSKAKPSEIAKKDTTVQRVDEEILPAPRETVPKPQHMKRKTKEETIEERTDKPRDLFLTLLAFVWFCAFTSLYVQLDGLFGRDGLAPAETNMRARIAKRAGLWEWVQASRSTPSLLWVAVYYNLDVLLGMKLLCGAGVLLSLHAVRNGGSGWIYGTLWVCYLSLVSVGSTFMQFQWDTLLLEVGFLGIWLACPTGSQPFSGYAPRTIRQLLRFTLFKLMLMSGVVKLQSGCPSWYKLTALSYHFATQCLPTPLAWWLSKLPENLLKLSVWSALVIEIPATALILSPFQIHRWIGFCLQVLLQVAIMLTGNYNFFNLLTLGLCVLLLDPNGKQKNARSLMSKLWRVLHFLNFLLGLALVAVGAHWILPLSFARSLTGTSITLDTNPARISIQTKPILLASSLVGLLYILACGMLDVKSASRRSFVSSKFRASAKSFLVVVGGLIYFATSCTALLSLDSSLLRNPGGMYAAEVYGALSPYHITSGYGLFRRMTGMGDGGNGQLVERPEIILLGSKDGENWEEFDFRHKPGNVSWVPTMVAPHQPRLDWQMWFAALGSAEEHPWFINLVYKLLHNSKAVRDLLNPEGPFADAPPRYIKADLYKYDFSKGSTTDWWNRKFDRRYLDVVDADSPILMQYANAYGFSTEKPSKRVKPHQAEDLQETILFTCAFIAVYEVVRRSLEVARPSLVGSR